MQHGVIGVGVLLQQRYRLVELIGQGGMGSVYKAHDEVLNRVVAIKALAPELIHNPEAVAIFDQEARVLARTTHPNLVSVYDVFQVHEHAFMSMEHVDGLSGDAIVARYPEGVPLDDGIQIATQLLAVLCYLHEQKIIHRDIKPNNFIVQPDGTLRLLDFGLARELELLVQRGTRVRGSPAYISPEHILGHDLTPRSDLYSFGVTLFELFTGRLPFERGDLAYHHAHTPPPAPEELRRDLPAPIAQLIRGSMKKSPEERPTSARAALRMLVNGLGAMRRSYPPTVVSLLNLEVPLQITGDLGERSTSPQRTLPGPVGLRLSVQPPLPADDAPAPVTQPPVAPTRASLDPLPSEARSPQRGALLLAGGVLAGALIVCAVFWVMLASTDAPPPHPATGTSRPAITTAPGDPIEAPADAPAAEAAVQTEPHLNAEASSPPPIEEQATPPRDEPPGAEDPQIAGKTSPEEPPLAEEPPSPEDPSLAEEPTDPAPLPLSRRDAALARQTARRRAATARAARKETAPTPDPPAATADKESAPPPSATPSEETSVVTRATTPKEEPPPPTKALDALAPPGRTAPQSPPDTTTTRPFAPSKPDPKDKSDKAATDQPRRDVPFGF
ncbi:MAG: hypothetical protein CMH57_15425 [Myxococcales bacterium]|nr:hypothetical protein [Myxococcales bacterium]